MADVLDVRVYFVFDALLNSEPADHVNFHRASLRGGGLKPCWRNDVAVTDFGLSG
ncbi:hypothetical protein ACFWMU_31465 [Streptomyces sp. NPDC058357]|uniref:hypothetical protein n=1 Tax=unclassified Streptomyces TaxID=2593676 RepID=UPI003656D159